MANLEDFKNDLAMEVYGMTTAEAHAKGVCINCKQPPRFKTAEGRTEYRISGMCEYCFDDLFTEDNSITCENCGKSVAENEVYRVDQHSYCSYACYGHDVGF